MLVHPETPCWVSSKMKVQKELLENPVGDHAGSHGWSAGKKLYSTKIWWKWLKCSSPRQSTVLKPVQADTGDVSQSSSCCPCHKANLQVDLTFHNTFPKTSPLVHYGCWPGAEINMQENSLHSNCREKPNQNGTKCPKPKLQSHRPIGLLSRPALPMQHLPLNPV